MKEKTQSSPEVVCFQTPGFETSKSNFEVSKSFRRKISSFSKAASLQREPFHNVLYFQPLPVSCNQERFYDNKYVEF